MFLVGMVQSVGMVMKKMMKPTGQLVKTTNAETSARQKTNIALNVEKETILPIDVG